jgi:hypothetical protein
LSLGEILMTRIRVFLSLGLELLNLSFNKHR